MTYYYDDELYHYDDELYHHGVKGMKWGVRKARKYISNGVSRIRRKASGFYNKHRRAINTAAGLAGAAALGYGAYRLDRATGGRAARALRTAGSRVANSSFGTTARDVYNSGRNRVSAAGRSLSSKYYGSKVHQTLSPIKRKVGNSAHRLIRDTTIAARGAGSRISGAARKYGSAAGGTIKKYGSAAGGALKNYGSRAANAVRNSNIGTNIRDVGYSLGQRAGKFGRQAGVTAARTYNTIKRKARRRG